MHVVTDHVLVPVPSLSNNIRFAVAAMLGALLKRPKVIVHRPAGPCYVIISLYESSAVDMVFKRLH